MLDSNKTLLYMTAKKSTGIAYALLFFFGELGAHRFYLRSTKMGLLYLFLGAGGIFMLSMGGGFFFGSGGTAGHMQALIGTLMIIAWAFMWFVDLFLLPSVARKCNLRIMSSIQNDQINHLI